MEPGTRADSEHSPLLALVRMTGFVLLSGLGLAVIAAVVLLPAYTRMAGVEYERACMEASKRDTQAMMEGYDRMIAEGAKDPVLIARLARSQLGLKVRNAEVVSSSQPPGPPPGMIVAPRSPRPAVPGGWMFDLEARLRDPGTRRGLLLIAIGGIAAAMFLFAPPGRSRKQPAPAA